MSLKETLQADLKEAMRQNDTVRKTALRLVLAAVTNAEIERGPLSDADIQAIIAKQVKQRQESLAAFQKGGREDLMAQEEAELKVLSAYLPQQMSRAEIEELAAQVIAQVGATSPRDLGKVMRELMPRVKGRADGRLVNEVVRELLSKGT